MKLSAMSDLFAILKSYISWLPKDPRTILQTVNTSKIEPFIKCVSNESYYHFGLAGEII